MQTDTQDVTAEWLQTLDPLAEVPLDQLQWMIDNSRRYSTPEGGYVFEAGDLLEGTHIVVLQGKIKLYMVQKNELREVSVLQTGDISGALLLFPGGQGQCKRQGARDCHLNDPSYRKIQGDDRQPL